VRVRIVFVLVVGLAVALGGEQAARASVMTGDWVVLSTGNGAVQYGDGGEFRVDVYDQDAFDSNGTHVSGHNSFYSFYTFCCGVSDVFVPGNAYQITAVASAPSNLNNTVGGWLFRRYWSNPSEVVPESLTGYVPGHNALAANQTIAGNSNTSVAGAIQATIWQSLGQTPPAGYNFVGLAQWADTTFGWSSLWQPVSGIAQIQLWGPNNNYGYGEPGQPQLYMPGVGQAAAAPEPASLLVWSLLAGAAWLGMRRGRR
jgi:hypothetical protein